MRPIEIPGMPQPSVVVNQVLETPKQRFALALEAELHGSNVEVPPRAQVQGAPRGGRIIGQDGAAASEKVVAPDAIRRNEALPLVVQRFGAEENRVLGRFAERFGPAPMDADSDVVLAKTHRLPIREAKEVDPDRDPSAPVRELRRPVLVDVTVLHELLWPLVIDFIKPKYPWSSPSPQTTRGVAPDDVAYLVEPRRVLAQLMRMISVEGRRLEALGNSERLEAQRFGGQRVRAVEQDAPAADDLAVNSSHNHVDEQDAAREPPRRNWCRVQRLCPARDFPGLKFTQESDTSCWKIDFEPSE